MSKSYVKFELFETLGVVVSRPGFVLAGPYAVCAMLERVGLWSLLEGKIVREIPSISSALVTALARSADLKTFAVGYSDGTIRIFSVSPFDEILTLHASRRPISSIAFRDDGDVLASASGTSISFWDLPSSRGMFMVEGLAAPAIHLRFLNDTTLIAGSTDGSMSAVCTVNQAVMSAVPAHSTVVRGLSVSFGRDMDNEKNSGNNPVPLNQKWILTVGDKELKAWELSEDKTVLTCVGVMNPPCGDVYGLEASGQFIGVFGQKNVLVYTRRSSKDIAKKEKKRQNKKTRKARLEEDYESSEEKNNEDNEDNTSEAMNKEAENRSLNDFFVQRSLIRIPEQPINIELVRELSDEGDKLFPHSVIISTISNRLIIYKPVNKDQTTSAISTMEVNRTVGLNGHRGQIRSLYASGDNNSLVMFSASDDGIKVWGVNKDTEQSGAPMPICSITNADLQESELLDTESSSTVRNSIAQGFVGVTGVCALKGNRFVVCGTKNGNVIVLDMGTARLSSITHCDSGVTAMACSADSSLIVTGHSDGLITTWTPVLVNKRRQSTSSPSSSEYELSLSLVKLWSIKCSDGVCALALSPDAVCLGKDIKLAGESSTRGVVYAALLDCTVRSFSLSTQKNIHILYGHSLPVFGISVSTGDIGETNNSIVATVSGDRTVRVWGGVFGECMRIVRLGALAHTASTASSTGLSGSTQTTSTSTNSVPGRPCIAILPDTHHAVVGMGDALSFVDCDTGRRVYDLFRCQGRYTFKAGSFTSVKAVRAGGVGTRTSVTICSGSTDGSIRVFSQYADPDEPEGKLVFEGDYEQELEEAELDLEMDNNVGVAGTGWEEAGMRPVGLGGHGDIKAIDRLEEALDIIETNGIGAEGNVLTMNLAPDVFILHVLKNWIVPTAIPYCLRMLTFPRALLLLMLLTRRIKSSGAKGIDVEFCITHGLDIVRIHKQTLLSTAKEALADFYNSVDADVLEARRRLAVTNYGVLEVLRRRIAVRNGDDA